MRSDRSGRRSGAVAALLAAALFAQPGPASLARPHPVRLDPFTVDAAQVAAVRATSGPVQCELRVRVWEPDRPDAARFPASALGAPVQVGAVGGRHFRLRAWRQVVPVLIDRIDLCRIKGFDSVVLLL